MPSPEEIERIRALADSVSEEAAEAGQVASDEEVRLITDSEQVNVSDGQAPEKTRAVCGFVVWQDEQGHWSADINIDTLKGLEFDRPATVNDFTPACAQIRDDVLMMKIVPNVVNNMMNAQMQVAAQMAEAQERARIAQSLDLRGGMRGGMRG